VWQECFVRTSSATTLRHGESETARYAISAHAVVARLRLSTLCFQKFSTTKKVSPWVSQSVVSVDSGQRMHVLGGFAIIVTLQIMSFCLNSRVGFEELIERYSGFSVIACNQVTEADMISNLSGATSFNSYNVLGDQIASSSCNRSKMFDDTSLLLAVYHQVCIHDG